jgi:hypothetical protein
MKMQMDNIPEGVATEGVAQHLELVFKSTKDLLNTGLHSTQAAI